MQTADTAMFGRLPASSARGPLAEARLRPVPTPVERLVVGAR